MNRRSRWGALGALLATFTLSSSTPAQTPGPCEARVTRATVVECALRSSPAVVREQRGAAAVEGKRTAASLLLPANPRLEGTLGRASSPTEGQGMAWTATLSQEIEIAGQRGARLDEVAAERDAQHAQLVQTERDVAAGALDAYFDVLAAAEEKRVADRLVELGTALTRLASGRLQEGLGSELDVDLALAAATRLSQAQIAAERHVATASTKLATALGLDPLRSSPTAEGMLEPLPTADMDADSLLRSAVGQRPEIAAADAERRAQERRADVYRRSRVPNVTVSVFAQNDSALNDRVLGVGLGLPIPLPAPLGHTYAGEIAEADARAERATAETERARRAVRLEVLTALETLASRKREVALFPSERLQRAEAALGAIARELEAKRLAVRDALVAQQGLVEMLQASVEARRQLCLASVELARVAGLPLERGAL